MAISPTPACLSVDPRLARYCLTQLALNRNAYAVPFILLMLQSTGGSATAALSYDVVACRQIGVRMKTAVIAAAHLGLSFRHPIRGMLADRSARGVALLVHGHGLLAPISAGVVPFSSPKRAGAIVDNGSTSSSRRQQGSSPLCSWLE